MNKRHAQLYRLLEIPTNGLTERQKKETLSRALLIRFYGDSPFKKMLEQLPGMPLVELEELIDTIALDEKLDQAVREKRRPELSFLRFAQISRAINSNQAFRWSAEKAAKWVYNFAKFPDWKERYPSGFRSFLKRFFDDKNWINKLQANRDSQRAATWNQLRKQFAHDPIGLWILFQFSLCASRLHSAYAICDLGAIAFYGRRVDTILGLAPWHPAARGLLFLYAPAEDVARLTGELLEKLQDDSERNQLLMGAECDKTTEEITESILELLAENYLF